MSGGPSITQLLEKFSGGDADALNQLTGLLYPELKAMARRRIRRGQAIGATTLVQETFVKLLSGDGVKPEDRVQFFGLAATIMRRVIIDDARQASAQKRQGIEVEYLPHVGGDKQAINAEFLLRVDHALNRLADKDGRLAQVFECRYFGGYSTTETADIVGLSTRSTERLWSNARTLLAAELNQ